MGPMNFQRRAAIVGLLAVIGLAVYCAGIVYSQALVVYVVEQSLVEKAPAGTDSALLRARFHAMLASVADKKLKLARVLAMSQDLEKVQTLTPQEVEQMLSVASKGRRPGLF